VRALSFADGSMRTSADRLPSSPSIVVALPERLGGGFLFALGTQLWRAPTWLGPASPIDAEPQPIAQVLVGLDRVYLRPRQGGLVPIDARSGEHLGMGPLPASPSIAALAALDAWQAVALADLRGALVTADAGSTWRLLALPVVPTQVARVDGALAVGGVDETRGLTWWQVRPDGAIARLPSAPPPDAPPPDAATERPAPPSDPRVRMFGPRPLLAAIEDGWPLVDGTALVARDGALARVRLSDGALIGSAAGAFSLAHARCHAVSLAQPGDATAFGFVCGEPRGATAVYRWDAAAGTMVELRRFDTPREILAFGNGALAARGPCDPRAPDEPRAGELTVCLMRPDGRWSPMLFRGDDVERARVVVLADGRVALVRPPRLGDLSSARLTLTDGANATHLPLAMPPLHAHVAQVLRTGVWLDGFEERRPGVVGGWVDGAGSVLGVEIDTGGRARVGEYVRVAGAPIVSGRWGLGWTASRTGYETTDGGMTWTSLDLPDPIAASGEVRERACGPVGCIAAGWMRVGWGATASPERPAPPHHGRPPSRPPSLDLECAALSARAPQPATDVRQPPAPEPLVARLPAPLLPAPLPRRSWSGGAHGTHGAAPGSVIRPPVLVAMWSDGPYATYGATSPFPPFAGRAGPPLAANDLGVSQAASSGLERALRSVPLARVYAWGPKSGDWDTLGRWSVRWQWPWGGWADARSSAPSPAPWTSLDGARRGLGGAPGSPIAWLLAPGDDADHALLVARRGSTSSSQGAEVLVLETDRPPVQARRADGEPWPDVEAAARIAGRWYLATAQSAGEPPSTVVWVIDGGTARALARVPRVGADAPSELRLAHRAEGGGRPALGLVVVGHPDGEHPVAPLWVDAVDLDSGRVGDPEPFAAVDLSDRPVSVCTGDETGGWELDLPYPGEIRIRIEAAFDSTVQSAMARVRVSRERACVERVLGNVEGYASSPPAALTALPWRALGERPTIEASIFSAQQRYALRCAAH
jgi:hypothetical protein